MFYLNKYTRYFVIFLCLIGVYHLVSFLILDIGSIIRAKVDHYYNLELKAEKRDDLAKRAYSLGRLWGEAAATDSSIDHSPNNSIVAQVLAREYLDKRDFFYCWGPSVDDCDDIPTDDRLKDLFGIDYGSKDMPIHAFSSGFNDAFYEYFKLN